MIELFEKNRKPILSFMLSDFLEIFYFILFFVDLIPLGHFSNNEALTTGDHSMIFRMQNVNYSSKCVDL